MNDKELFTALRELINEKWHTLPDYPRGTGAPGNYLESMLGLETSNSDTPDTGRWELKYCSGNALLTLFHKTPHPKGCIRDMIQQFGWEGKNGHLSFRHTILGQSERGFKVVHDDNFVRVRHNSGTGPAPYWTKDDLLGHAGGKLRRLLVVDGEQRQGQVRFKGATAYKDISLTRFMDALTTGLIAVDFDARMKGSGAVRDHGTKFRISIKNLPNIYKHTDKL